MKNVLVYCGSRSGNSGVYKEMAEELGHLLVKRNCRLVYGGGDVGLMGVISNTMLSLGGEVIGVIPQALLDREVANKNCTELEVVKDMSERKIRMEQLSDCIITLPGGYGSMDELFESLTNVQLGISEKKIGILNLGGFYDPLLQQLDVMVAAGFLLGENRSKLISGVTPVHLLDAMSI